jgi:hypothetical protein
MRSPDIVFHRPLKERAHIEWALELAGGLGFEPR